MMDADYRELPGRRRRPATGQPAVQIQHVLGTAVPRVSGLDERVAVSAKPFALAIRHPQQDAQPALRFRYCRSRLDTGLGRGNCIHGGDDTQ